MQSLWMLLWDQSDFCPRSTLTRFSKSWHYWHVLEREEKNSLIMFSFPPRDNALLGGGREGPVLSISGLHLPDAAAPSPPIHGNQKYLQTFPDVPQQSHLQLRSTALHVNPLIGTLAIDKLHSPFNRPVFNPSCSELPVFQGDCGDALKMLLFLPD